MQTSKSFYLLRSVLDLDDIRFLKQRYKDHLAKNLMPCYALLDFLNSNTYQKIFKAVSGSLGFFPQYLNDFFFYTNENFSTSWHVDTELYAFSCAANAWILLEPNQVDNPLAFISSVNNPGQDLYHVVEKEKDNYLFANYSEGCLLELPVETVEQEIIQTPTVQVGDLLIIDPLRFHRTNTLQPKGACAIKFLYGDFSSCLRTNQVPAIMWPEVELYNNLVASSNTWEAFQSLIKNEIQSNALSSSLVQGFYPDKFQFLATKASTF